MERETAIPFRRAKMQGADLRTNKKQKERK